MAKRGQNTICPVCGVLFYRYPSAIKRGRDFTCSRTCAARHFRDKGIMVNCGTCGKEIYRRKSLAEKGYANFCSKPCWAASRNIKVECSCLQCGAFFMKGRWEVENTNGGRFCTRSCADKFKRKLRKRGEQEMFTQWQRREWIDTKCARCNAAERLELDHIIPRFAGGRATRENAQTLCRTCNRNKFWIDDYPKYRDLLTLRAEAC